MASVNKAILILMSRAEHMKLHRAEQTKESGNGKC